MKWIPKYNMTVRWDTKPVYDAFQKAKDKPGFKAKHEAELVIFEAARSTLLAIQGGEKQPSLKTLQAEQQRLLEEQQRLYNERAKLKKEARMIDTLKANVDDFLKPVSERKQEQKRNNQTEWKRTPVPSKDGTGVLSNNNEYRA